MGHAERKFQTEGGVAHQPMLVSENQSDCPLVWYQNIRSVLFGFVTKHACDKQTDEQTDRITISKTALAQLHRAVKSEMLSRTQNSLTLSVLLVVATQLLVYLSNCLSVFSLVSPENRLFHLFASSSSPKITLRLVRHDTTIHNVCQKTAEQPAWQRQKINEKA